MTYKQRDQHILIGVTSFGWGKSIYVSRPIPGTRNKQCGVSSNFARVALARDWIDNQLKEATFCQNNGDADDQ